MSTTLSDVKASAEAEAEADIKKLLEKILKAADEILDSGKKETKKIAESNSTLIGIITQGKIWIEKLQEAIHKTSNEALKQALKNKVLEFANLSSQQGKLAVETSQGAVSQLELTISTGRIGTENLKHIIHHMDKIAGLEQSSVVMFSSQAAQSASAQVFSTASASTTATVTAGNTASTASGCKVA